MLVLCMCVYVHACVCVHCTYVCAREREIKRACVLLQMYCKCTYMFVWYVCVCVCVRACVHACVRACVQEQTHTVCV